MALNYGDNYILKIKKGTTEYLVRDSIAEAAINVIQGDSTTAGSIAKAQADAQAYADSLVEGLSSTYDAAGAASAAETAAKAYADGLASNYDATGAAAAAETSAKAYADGLASNYDATGAAAAAETAAKTYAKNLVDALLGEDSASTTLATLKQVIQELTAPENQNGIAGTFIDTVKADLAGLVIDDGNGGTAAATVKQYVDAEVAKVQSAATGGISDLDAEVTSSDVTNVQVKVTEVDGVITAVNVTTDNTVNATAVNTAITTAIEALDATPTQTAGADGLALSLTQVDGVVTAISGSIAANTYDSYGSAAAVLGASTDTSTAATVYGAKAYTDEQIAQHASTIANGILTLGF